MKTSFRHATSHALAYAALFLLVAIYILIFVRRQIYIRWTPADYYPKLAEAFLEGRLDLQGTLHLTDLSRFGEKWYLYWGPMPSVWMMPFRAAMGHWFTGQIAGVIVAIGSMFVWLSTLKTLRARGLFCYSNPTLLFLAIFTVGGTNLHSLCMIGSIWELSHAFTFFYLSLSLRFGLSQGRGRAFWSSVFFACAILTRLSMLVLLPVFVGGLAVLGARSSPQRRIDLRQLAWMLCPIAVALGLQLFYNHSRFGSIWETGFAFQNDRSVYRGNYLAHGLLSTHYFLQNFSVYFLSPIRYFASWPALGYDAVGNSFWSYEFGVFILLLPALGSLTSARFRRESRNAEGVAIHRWCLTAWVVYLLFLLFLYTPGWVAFGNRYLADVLPLMLVSIFLTLERVRPYRWLRLPAFCLIALSFVPQLLFRFQSPLS